MTDVDAIGRTIQQIIAHNRRFYTRDQEATWGVVIELHYGTTVRRGLEWGRHFTNALLKPCGETEEQVGENMSMFTLSGREYLKTSNGCRR